MYVLLIVLLVVKSHAQSQTSQCRCLCCLGQPCTPVEVSVIPMQNCSVEMCARECRCAYSACAGSAPYGQVLSQCVPAPTIPFNCGCHCCKTGSITCIPTFVGNTIAPFCDQGSCSVQCYKAYPSQCGSDPDGQTQGTCLSPVTTTTTASTIAPWLSYICSCFYCQFGAPCSSGVIVGIASASQCSLSDCTQACQSRYTSTCTTSYLSSISGVCLSQENGRNKCKCNCCRGYGCLNYEINTNDTCTSCYAKCQQVSPCTNTPTVTATCVINNSMIIENLSLIIIFMISVIVMNVFN